MKAIVLGATGGLGRAFVEATGVSYEHVFAIGRQEMSFGDRVSCHRFDNVNTLAKIADEIKCHEDVELIVVAVGLLHSNLLSPEKRLQDCDGNALQSLYYSNTILPAMMMKYFLPCLSRSTGKMMLLSAKVGSITDNRLGGWYGYRSSKAALNMLVKTAAIEHKRLRPEHVIVAMHPGTVNTALSQPFHGHIPSSQILSPEESVGDMMRTLATISPEQSGCFLDRFGQTIPW